MADLLEKFNALSLRERIIIVLAALGCIWLLTYTFAVEPAMKKLERQQRQLNSRQQTVQQNLQLIEDYIAQQNESDDSLRMQQREHLQQAITQTDEQLGRYLGDLIPPERMLPVLHALLVQASDVTLEQIQSQPPQRFGTSVTTNADTNNDPQAAPAVGQPTLYQHELQIQISGSYFKLKAFIERLEALPWKFNWQGLEYRVDKYPNAIMQIRIYTLSERSVFIHV